MGNSDMTGIPGSRAPYSVHLCRGDELLGIDARLLERAVFLEVFGNTPELMDAEYGRYEAHSLFITVLDNEAERVAGVVRLICDGAGDLKSLTDIEGPPWHVPLADALAPYDLDLSTTLDLATLAVHPDYRGDATAGLVSLALYQAIAMLARAARMTHLVAILDCVVLESAQTRTGQPFAFYPGVDPAPYLDSPLSVPVISEFEAYEQRLRRDVPELHELMFEGIGFESVITPVDIEAGAARIVDFTTRSVIDLRSAPGPVLEGAEAGRQEKIV